MVEKLPKINDCFYPNEKKEIQLKYKTQKAIKRWTI